MFSRETALTVNRSALLAGALVASLAGGQAQAAADYLGGAEATIYLFDAVADVPAVADPADLIIFYSAEEDADDGVPAGAGSASGAADASGTLFGSFFEPEFAFTVFAEAVGDAVAIGPGLSESFAMGYAGFEIEISNDNPGTGYTIFGEISFDLFAEAHADAPGFEGAAAAGDVFLTSAAAGDLLAGAPADPFAVAEAGFGGVPVDTDASTLALYAFTVYLPALGSDVLYLEAAAEGFAEATLVPIPAALPLLASALLGLCVVRRRA